MNDLDNDQTDEQSRSEGSERDIIRLSPKEQERFAGIVNDPPPLSAALQRAAEHHCTLIAPS